MPVAAWSSNMHARLCFSAPQALYRVFVQPTPLTLANQCVRLSAQNTRQHLRTIVSEREKRKYGPKDGTTTTARPMDEKIGERYIDLVDKDGQFQPKVPLIQVLRNINRPAERVVLVTPKKASDPDSRPICRIMSEAQLQRLAEAAEQQEIERKKRLKDAKAKMVEIGWGADKNDIARKLNNMKEFLAAGKRVEVTMMKKKKSKPVGPEEWSALLQAVTEAIAEVPGAKEVKDREGALGGHMTIFLQGKKPAS